MRPLSSSPINVSSSVLLLAVGVAALMVWLLLDKVARAIVWDTLRHPFTRSRIEVKDGKVHVVHLSSGEAGGR